MKICLLLLEVRFTKELPINIVYRLNINKCDRHDAHVAGLTYRGSQ